MKSFLDWLIEAAMTFPEALQIFGLSQAPATEKELSTLYKKLAMKKHPDHGGSTREMQELNAAKDILKKNLGSDGTRSYSRNQKKSGGDYFDILKRNDEMIAKSLENLFLLLDEKAYQEWFEQHFSKPFTIEVKRGTYSSIFTSIPLPTLEMTAYSAGHAEVFIMKLTATVLNADRNASSIGGKKTTFAYYVSSEALVGGKKQVMSRQKSWKATDSLPLTHPDTVFPSIKLRKIINGNARKGSKMARRDFATIFETRWGCETSTQKNWWLFQFDESSDNVAAGLSVERVTLNRESFYTFGSGFWFKKTTTKYSVWNRSSDVKIQCEYMPEDRETADFIESVFAYARKIKDLQKIADFIKSGSKQINLRHRLANES